MLDREVQYHILTMLADAYPIGVPNPSEEMGLDAKVGSQNFHYLAEHGLVRLNKTQDIGPQYPAPAVATITASRSR